MFMRNFIIVMAGLFSGAVLAAEQSLAPQPEQEPQREQVQAQEKAQQQERVQQKQQVRGRDLMTPEERNQYREKMRNTKTEVERRALRQEHHKAMQERAKERGLTLPEQPWQSPGGGMGGGRQGMGERSK